MHDGGTSQLDGQVTDPAIFDPDSWNLTDFEASLCAETRTLAQARFAPRAAEIDREARFPTENYADLKAHDLLGICIPAEHGGRGADLRAYMLAAAEIGRYCGATALTFNMHVSSCLWTGVLADGVTMTASQREEHAAMRTRHYRRILEEGAIYAQPFSEGGDAAAGKAAFGTTAVRTEGGWIVNGRKIFASLSGHADYYGVLCTELETGIRRWRRTDGAPGGHGRHSPDGCQP